MAPFSTIWDRLKGSPTGAHWMCVSATLPQPPHAARHCGAFWELQVGGFSTRRRMSLHVTAPDLEPGHDLDLDLDFPP